MSDVTIKIEGFDRIIFKKAELKRAIRKGGAVVRSEARRLIAKRAISAPGQLPGSDTGVMKKSIKSNVGSEGGYVKVMPYLTDEMANNTRSKKTPRGHFYPAYLFYGTSRGLKPRKNFMIEALDNKQAQIRAEIRKSLAHALATA